MITIISYLLLTNYGEDYTGWLYVLPVITDLVLLGKIEGFGK